MLIKTLPDITAHSNPQNPSSLQWVGMEGLAVPISIKLQDGNLKTVAAKADVYVNLKEVNAKGIHMSRLHMEINRLSELECNKPTIERLLDQIIHSQSGISSEAKIKLVFEVMLKKTALISDEAGYQIYPVSVSAEKRETETNFEFEITIPYSSTCPCSASLARQLYANAVDKTFLDEKIDKTELLSWIESEAGSIATPHSQRSYAYVRLTVGDHDWPDLSQLIFMLESTIGTPVQTVVKRGDEQEFARLNAENLMFCEDAARRVKENLNQMKSVKEYWLKVEHQESLHAHNAVVIDKKMDNGST